MGTAENKSFFNGGDVKPGRKKHNSHNLVSLMMNSHKENTGEEAPPLLLIVHTPVTTKQSQSA